MFRTEDQQMNPHTYDHLSFVQGDKNGSIRILLHVYHQLKQHHFFEKKVGKSLEHIGTGENFLNRTPMAYVLQSRIDKWNLIKLQSFIKAKDTLNRRKWQAIDWWKIFNNSTSDRRIISNIYKELKKLDSMEPNNPIKKNREQS